MRRADVEQAAVNPAVIADMLEPRFITGAELRDAAAKYQIFGQSGEFRISLRYGLQHFVVDHRLLGFFRAFRRHPSAVFEQRADLLA